MMNATFHPEFDTPYAVTARGTIIAPPVAAPMIGHYIPSVEDDTAPGGDISIDGVPVRESDWDALTGYTGQYGYNGAVMHASEHWTSAMLKELAGYADAEGIDCTAFAVVEVRDESGQYPDGDPIGWAVIYRTIGVG